MNSDNDLKILRHSAAHLLAHAVIELFPKTLLTIGPATQEGFFYDFLPETNFTDADLAAIEARMHILADKNLAISHQEISKEKARELYKNNPFKLELIEGIPGDSVGLSIQGDFYDLCRGGHVSSTGLLKNFKLIGISGAYWRADRNNKPLQRISGTAFFTAQELAEYEQKREDALKYDHRKLGKQLNLFSFHEEGPGFVFFHPKGTVILNCMINYLRTLLAQDEYQEIRTPIMLSDALWRQSGHYQYYKDNMYFCTIDNETYAVRPMNCPGSILVYADHPHSYRELPMRLAEFGLVHRYELSGVLHGLMRVRAFTQDDAHVYCMPNQIEQEIIKMIKMAYTVYKKFQFNSVKVHLATRPEKSMGSDQLWNVAIASLKNALDSQNIPFKLMEGEGAFYGPKIEFHIEDSMGRSWQCGTIQVDFFLPENFDLHFVNSQGTKERPVMVHRAIYGSLERFFGILLEHYKGTLPFWLSPLQARLLTITDEQKKYARSIAKALKAEGVRVDVDESGDPLSGQIKTAQLEKIPWMIIVGNKEMAQNTVTIRYLDGKQEMGLSLAAVIEKTRKELAS